MDMSLIYAHGKLLLTGEYGVLEGALALGLPTRLGQSLQCFEHTESGILYWQSYTAGGNRWLEARFQAANFSLCRTPFTPEAMRLQQILRKIRERNPNFLKESSPLGIQTILEFPLEWGLGSSATLISNLAALAQVDAFWLQRETFGGSGYDIACARHDQPILFQNKGAQPFYQEVDFSPPFADRLYFVYLNRKQNSRAAIAAYRRATQREDLVKTLTQITRAVVEASDLSTFEALLVEHEQAVGQVLGAPPVKTQYFSDYPHAVKSLGAWGGDFALAVGGETAPAAYFRKKGFPTLIPYREMLV